MGSLTTITLYNDALHDFEKEPEKFALALFDGINRANDERQEVSVGFGGYANYISVQPSYHADDEQLYLHSGNCVTNLNPWSKDFQNLRPDLQKDFIARAERMIKEAKRKIKKRELENDQNN